MFRVLPLILFAPLCWGDTQYFQIHGTTHLYLPQNNGARVAIGASALTDYYPSRSQWGQFVILDDGTDLRMIRATESNVTASQYWLVVKNVSGSTAPCVDNQWCLEITFYEDADPTVVDTTYSNEQNWRVPAADYKAWAQQQSWYASHGKLAGVDLGFIATLATNSYSFWGTTTKDLISDFPGQTIGVFWTGYRTNSFDDMYPDYECVAGANCTATLDDISAVSGIAFPYINGALWDDQEAGYSAANMCLDNVGTPYAYTSPTDLKYVDPLLSTWPTTLRSEFDAITDTSGNTSGGVYLDVMTSQMQNVCHYSGTPDYTAWITGARALLTAFDDKIVMVEGAGEIFLPYIDIIYAHSGTDTSTRIPMLSYIYGDVVTLVGWHTASTDNHATLRTDTIEAFDTFGIDAMLYFGGRLNDALVLQSGSLLTLLRCKNQQPCAPGVPRTAATARTAAARTAATARAAR